MGATNFSSSSVVVHRFFPASPANSTSALHSKKSKKKNGPVFCSSSFSSSSSKVAAKAAATVLLLMTTTTNTAALAMNADVLSSGATITTESSSSVFNGRYSDPNHPGCLRGIEVRSKTSARVFGEDGTPGCSAGEKTKKWELEGELRGKEEILIDFSKKGGPKNLLGKWTGSGVLFPDGNTWSKL